MCGYWLFHNVVVDLINISYQQRIDNHYHTLLGCVQKPAFRGHNNNNTSEEVEEAVSLLFFLFNIVPTISSVTVNFLNQP